MTAKKVSRDNIRKAMEPVDEAVLKATKTVGGFAKDTTVKTTAAVKNAARAAEPKVRAAVEKAAKAAEPRVRAAGRAVSETTVKAGRKAVDAGKKALEETGKRAVGAGQNAVTAVNTRVYVQWGSREVLCSDLTVRAKEDFRRNNRAAVRSCVLYIKPEDGTAYYVINGVQGKIPL